MIIIKVNSTIRSMYLIVFFFSISLIYTYAQSAKEESIKELFRVMKQDSIIDKMFSSMVPSLLKQIQVEGLQENDNELMEYTMLITKEMCLKMINEDMVVLYSRYFNEREINDFITFYKTPAAQKLISVMPDITKELMIISMKKYVPDMIKKIQGKMKTLGITSTE